MNTTSGRGPQKIVFRVDASITIGTGHVMRCLTLADALREQGVECHFICREHSGHLIDTVRARGFSAFALPVSPSGKAPVDTSLPEHAAWLNSTWQNDARQSGAILGHLAPGWLIVDHYALDKRWEEAVLPSGCQLMVIDDLADREHRADLLLDQNLGRQSDDYRQLVPEHCTQLIGPRYALLRPEFSLLRRKSLARRKKPRLKQLLITMGGVDKDNATGQVLDALMQANLPDDCRISVVMGGNAPWLAQIKAQAAEMPWPTEVAVNVPDMGERMSQADLAIGAAGSTSWERCCLGLPTLMVVVAANQWSGARALFNAGAAWLVGDIQAIERQLPQAVQQALRPGELSRAVQAASAVTAGEGRRHVLNAMTTGNLDDG